MHALRERMAERLVSQSDGSNDKKLIGLHCIWPALASTCNPGFLHQSGKSRHKSVVIACVCILVVIIIVSFDGFGGEQGSDCRQTLFRKIPSQQIRSEGQASLACPALSFTVL